MDNTIKNVSIGKSIASRFLLITQHMCVLQGVQAFMQIPDKCFCQVERQITPADDSLIQQSADIRICQLHFFQLFRHDFNCLLFHLRLAEGRKILSGITLI